MQKILLCIGLAQRWSGGLFMFIVPLLPLVIFGVLWDRYLIPHTFLTVTIMWFAVCIFEVWFVFWLSISQRPLRKIMSEYDARKASRSVR